jgi:glycosyltransferase involved in cell wall biosynthesis
MHIAHFNLAKAFRGGERQTELLIRAHAAAGLAQTAIVRAGGELAERLVEVPGLRLRPIGKPYSWRLSAWRDTDLLHAHETRGAQVAYLSSRLSRQPYLITRRVIKRPGDSAFTRAMYRNATCVAGLSRAVVAVMDDYLPGLRQQRIPSMAAGFASDAAKVAAIRANYPADALLVLQVGALVRHDKGQQFSIEVARRLADSHPRLQFLFLGNGGDEAALREQAAGLANVHFLGFQRDVGDWLGAADIFFFPSVQEGLGSSLLDAMDAELPIIASDVGGIPDVVSDGDNGLLLPVGDVDGLAAALRQLHDDGDLRARLGARGRELVEGYRPTAIARRFRELYAELLRES